MLIVYLSLYFIYLLNILLNIYIHIYIYIYIYHIKIQIVNKDIIYIIIYNSNRNNYDAN